ncbi:hypothetical protein V2595_09715 [Tenacibaculum maritimum]|uniref:hypothetical protein n=1 Tax=Tenacibaculum maritimum TaxID=107401 RepID=UPI0038766D81
MIKQLITYLFVFLYMVAMLRPITPFVEYAINYDYISTVLCINKDKPESSCKGKCQLMKKLEQQQEDDFNSLQISMEEYPIGFVQFINFTGKKLLYTYKTKLFFYKQNYSYLFECFTFHPPNVFFS